MPIKLDISFNAFSWSLALVFFFVLLLFIVKAAFISTGYQPGLIFLPFTWFAVSAAIAYSLISRYSAALRHLLVVQAMASFYLVAWIVATAMRKAGEGDVVPVMTVVASTVTLLISGVIGVALIKALKERAS